jgi:hypothetical protein
MTPDNLVVFVYFESPQFIVFDEIPLDNGGRLQIINYDG